MSKTYTTIQGDMWDLIAYKVYGNELYMETLLKANTRYTDIAVFSSGIILVCPEINTAKTIITVPWRK